MIFLRRIFHRHIWTFSRTCWGEMPKDNTPEKRYVRGWLETCGCGAKRLVPTHVELNAVEVE